MVERSSRAWYKPNMRSRYSLLILLAVTYCGPPPHPVHPHTSPDEALTPELLSRLSLPPTKASREALNLLKQIADQGSCQAAWLRGQYLIDLFDAARLLPQDLPYAQLGLSVLWSSIGLAGEPARGRLATRQVLVSLTDVLSSVPEDCPQRAMVNTANRLLDTDQERRTTTREALAVVMKYKEIAYSKAPLAPNALLRLVDWCAKAFRLAAGGESAQMHVRLNQCLYPLFDADPTPYFEADAAKRPPDPPWPILRAALDKLRSQLLGTRLRKVAEQLQKTDSTFFELAAASLPTPLNLGLLTPPRDTGGVPWDRTPLVLVSDRGYVVGGLAVLEEDAEGLVKAVAKRLHNDRRGRLTVVASPSSPASRIIAVARAASRAGAHTLELGIARRVADQPSAGDVQAAIFDKQPVLRLEGIPVFVGMFASSAVPNPARDQPRGMAYDPRTATSKLALILGRGGLRIRSRDGSLSPFRFEDLSARIKTLRKAYPFDRSLVLAPDPSALYSELVGVASRARTDGLPGLALSTPGRLETPPERDLAPVLRLLATASIAFEPLLSRSWPDLARRCYLETLRGFVQGSKKPPEGTLKLRTGPRGTRLVGGTLRHVDLRRCMTTALAKKATSKPATVSVSFKVGL